MATVLCKHEAHTNNIDPVLWRDARADAAAKNAAKQEVTPQSLSVINDPLTLTVDV